MTRSNALRAGLTYALQQGVGGWNAHVGGYLTRSSYPSANTEHLVSEMERIDFSAQIVVALNLFDSSFISLIWLETLLGQVVHRAPSMARRILRQLSHHFQSCKWKHHWLGTNIIP